MDCYDVDVLSNVKRQLRRDIFILKSSRKLPHVPLDREDEISLARKLTMVSRDETINQSNWIFIVVTVYVGNKNTTARSTGEG